MKNQTEKFETIIESYINGNMSWVKEQVKKLSKQSRKDLYEYADGIAETLAVTDHRLMRHFFLSLI